jgi:hypothetical protein
MISAIITDIDDPVRLEATLAALAPAAIDGFVRELIIVGRGAGADALTLAEEAGARVIGEGEAAFAQACAAARQPWLLILPAGVRLQVGWEAVAHAHTRQHPDMAGWFQLALPGRGVAARFAEAIAAARSRHLGLPAPAQGLLIARNRALEVARPDLTSLADLVRRLGRSRLRKVAARALGPAG